MWRAPDTSRVDRAERFGRRPRDPEPEPRPSRAAGVLALQRLVGNHQVTRMLQRVMAADVFGRLDHSLVVAAPQPMARVTRDVDGAVCRVRREGPPGNQFEVQAGNAQAPWVVVTGLQLQLGYTWADEKIAFQIGHGDVGQKARGRDQSVVGPGAANQVLDQFAGDDLAMVHHSQGGGSDPHLTVENAHISALHHIVDFQKINEFKKGEKQKPEHEDLMAAYGSVRTDNLNFFEEGGEQEVHNTLSLAQYLRVIRHAMDQIANVPPVYGIEVVRSANRMAQAHNLDPAALFLPSGEGQERHLFRAALNMHRMNLIAVPAPVVAAFAGYAQPIPTLTDPADGTVVRYGEGKFNQLERDLCNAHLAALITYLNTL